VSNFDPIPRLQQIAATIEDGGRFDSPATAAHYITCAIREIERLRQECGEARRAIGDSLQTLIHLRQEQNALRAERDEARTQEEKFSDDALRFLIERNRALDERDEARREVCGWAGQARNLDPNVIAMQRGWNVKVKHEPDAKHDRPEEVVVVKVGRHRVREIKR
jgi:hypothetical protein